MLLPAPPDGRHNTCLPTADGLSHGRRITWNPHRPSAQNQRSWVDVSVRHSSAPDEKELSTVRVIRALNPDEIGRGEEDSWGTVISDPYLGTSYLQALLYFCSSHTLLYPDIFYNKKK